MTYDIPDHPVIRNLETHRITPDGTGNPRFPVCPVCWGAETDTFLVRNKDLDIVGCETSA
jgi:hypothetical protein